MVHIDIVVAVRNEEKSILPFVESINSLNISDADIKLLFVEDGSTDGTLGPVGRWYKSVGPILQCF